MPTFSNCKKTPSNESPKKQAPKVKMKRLTTTNYAIDCPVNWFIKVDKKLGLVICSSLDGIMFCKASASTRRGSSTPLEYARKMITLQKESGLWTNFKVDSEVELTIHGQTAVRQLITVFDFARGFPRLKSVKIVIYYYVKPGINGELICTTNEASLAKAEPFANAIGRSFTFTRSGRADTR